MIDMKKISELKWWYMDHYPGLNIDVKVVDTDEYLDELDGLEPPIVNWWIDAKAFFAYEYFVNGCHGFDTDEIIQRLNKDITYFLQKDEVKRIIKQNRFEGVSHL